MARMARVVIPTIPHHITQRGVRRLDTFFDKEDYEIYLSLMREWCEAAGVDIWAYCLMPNHVHLIGVPESKNSLARGIGEAHRRYTRYVNFKNSWKGYLWQGRFASFPMDEDYLLAACRYVELNPVRAKLVKRPEDYRWSSATAHLAGKDDGLVKVQPMLERVSDWSELLASGDQGLFDDVRQHERTGRPLGGESFVSKMSAIMGRDLAKKKPGPKRKKDN
jgi:putative transposase